MQGNSRQISKTTLDLGDVFACLGKEEIQTIP